MYNFIIIISEENKNDGILNNIHTGLFVNIIKFNKVNTQQ